MKLSQSQERRKRLALFFKIRSIQLARVVWIFLTSAIFYKIFQTEKLTNVLHAGFLERYMKIAN